MSGALSLKPSYYEALKRLTLELAGVKLDQDHTFLVETRLSALARKEGFENLSDMVDQLFSRGQTRLAVHVVSALLERATRFFDDPTGFEILKDKILPTLHQSYQGGRVRILCYGCSSGQEVYSTSILADSLRGTLPNMEIEVVGVDYPSWALEQAKEGRFTHFEVQRGLPIRDLVKYFDRDGEDWVAKPSLRDSVCFHDHNLMSGLDDIGTYQVVMFRGRYQQYTSPAILRILRNFHGLIADNGYLMLGSKEKIEKLHFGFDAKPIAPGCYFKPAMKIETDEEHTANHKPSQPLVEYSAA